MGNTECKPRPNTDYLKSGTGRMGSNALPPLNAFCYKTMYRREQLPKFHDKPIMGLKSNKNFICSNVVENVTTAPKKLPAETNYLPKNDYGQVPKY